MGSSIIETEKDRVNYFQQCCLISYLVLHTGNGIEGLIKYYIPTYLPSNYQHTALVLSDLPDKEKKRSENTLPNKKTHLFYF